MNLDARRLLQVCLAVAVGTMSALGAKQHDLASQATDKLKSFCETVSRDTPLLHPGAYLRLGDCYRLGLGGPHSTSKAVESYRLAGVGGEVDGWWRAGIELLFHSHDREKHVLGFKYLQRAHELGAISGSANFIAMLYLTGRVVDADTEKGLEYLGEGAETADPVALATLYYLYSSGAYGVKRDLYTANLYRSVVIELLHYDSNSDLDLDGLVKGIERNFHRIAREN